MSPWDNGSQERVRLLQIINEHDAFQRNPTAAEDDLDEAMLHIRDLEKDNQ